MNRSLSVVVLAALPASLRAGPTSDTRVARLLRHLAERRALKARARRLALAESAATRIALAREGISIDRSRVDVPRTTGHPDYDVLRRIR
jgi:hypothetical protein